MFGCGFLKLAVDDIFNHSTLSDNIDQHKAVFTSRPDRNLLMLLDIWKNNLFKNSKNKLYITPSKEASNFYNYNVFSRDMLNQKDYLNNIKNSRLMLIPGHKAELFCLAAEEARELCIQL